MKLTKEQKVVKTATTRVLGSSVLLRMLEDNGVEEFNEMLKLAAQKYTEKQIKKVSKKRK